MAEELTFWQVDNDACEQKHSEMITSLMKVAQEKEEVIRKFLGDIPKQINFEKLGPIGKTEGDDLVQYQYPSEEELMNQKRFKKLTTVCFYRREMSDFAILGISIRDYKNKQIKLGNTSKIGTGYTPNKYSPKKTKFIEMIIDHGKIQFYRQLDNNNNELSAYDPKKSGERKRIEIPDNHVIIGFHGWHDDNYIRSIGAITAHMDLVD